MKFRMIIHSDLIIMKNNQIYFYNFDEITAYCSTCYFKNVIVFMYFMWFDIIDYAINFAHQYGFYVDYHVQLTHMHPHLHGGTSVSK